MTKTKQGGAWGRIATAARRVLRVGLRTDGRRVETTVTAAAIAKTAPVPMLHRASLQPPATMRASEGQPTSIRCASCGQCMGLVPGWETAWALLCECGEYFYARSRTMLAVRDWGVTDVEAALNVLDRATHQYVRPARPRPGQGTDGPQGSGLPDRQA